MLSVQICQLLLFIVDGVRDSVDTLDIGATSPRNQSFSSASRAEVDNLVHAFQSLLTPQSFIALISHREYEATRSPPAVSVSVNVSIGDSGGANQSSPPPLSEKCTCAKAGVVPFPDPAQYVGEAKDWANGMIKCGMFASESDCLSSDSCQWVDLPAHLKNIDAIPCVPLGIEKRFKWHMIEQDDYFTGCEWMQDVLKCDGCAYSTPAECAQIPECEMERCTSGFFCRNGPVRKENYKTCIRPARKKKPRKLKDCEKDPEPHMCYHKALSAEKCVLKHFLPCSKIRNEELCEAMHKDLSCGWWIRKDEDQCDVHNPICSWGTDFNVPETLLEVLNKEGLGAVVHDAIHCHAHGKSACTGT